MSHNLQLCFPWFLHSWILMWCFKKYDWLKVLSQFSHLYILLAGDSFHIDALFLISFSPWWTERICCLALCLIINMSKQILHCHFFLPSWTICIIESVPMIFMEVYPLNQIFFWIDLLFLHILYIHSQYQAGHNTMNSMTFIGMTLVLSVWPHLTHFFHTKSPSKERLIMHGVSWR